MFKGRPSTPAAATTSAAAPRLSILVAIGGSAPEHHALSAGGAHFGPQLAPASPGCFAAWASLAAVAPAATAPSLEGANGAQPASSTAGSALSAGWEDVSADAQSFAAAALELAPDSSTRAARLQDTRGGAPATSEPPGGGSSAAGGDSSAAPPPDADANASPADGRLHELVAKAVHMCARNSDTLAFAAGQLVLSEPPDACSAVRPLCCRAGQPCIALVLRGTCSFQRKVANAAAAGAVGVVVLNRPQRDRVSAMAASPGEPQPAVPSAIVAAAHGSVLLRAARQQAVVALLRRPPAGMAPPASHGGSSNFSGKEESGASAGEQRAAQEGKGASKSAGVCEEGQQGDNDGDEYDDDSDERCTAGGSQPPEPVEGSCDVPLADGSETAAEGGCGQQQQPAAGAAKPAVSGSCRAAAGAAPASEPKQAPAATAARPGTTTATAAVMVQLVLPHSSAAWFEEQVSRPFGALSMPQVR